MSEESEKIVARLRLVGPDSDPVDPKAIYATKPRALLDEAADLIEALVIELALAQERVMYE